MLYDAVLDAEGLVKSVDEALDTGTVADEMIDEEDEERGVVDGNDEMMLEEEEG